MLVPFNFLVKRYASAKAHTFTVITDTTTNLVVKINAFINSGVENTFLQLSNPIKVALVTVVNLVNDK